MHHSCQIYPALKFHASTTSSAIVTAPLATSWRHASLLTAYGGSSEWQEEPQFGQGQQLGKEQEGGGDA